MFFVKSFFCWLLIGNFKISDIFHKTNNFNTSLVFPVFTYVLQLDHYWPKSMGPLVFLEQASEICATIMNKVIFILNTVIYMIFSCK